MFSTVSLYILVFCNHIHRQQDLGQCSVHFYSKSLYSTSVFDVEVNRHHKHCDVTTAVITARQNLLQIEKYFDVFLIFRLI